MPLPRARRLALRWVVLGLTAGLACDGRPPAPKIGRAKWVPRVTVVVAERVSPTVRHVYPCARYGPVWSEVRSPVDGFVAEVFVQEGQAVKVGDPLFRTRPPRDSPETLAMLRDRDAEDATRADFRDDGFRSRPGDDLSALSALGNQDNVIKAVRDGRVGPIERRPGQPVRKAGLLTSVAQRGEIRAEFSLPEPDYLKSVARWSVDPKVPDLRLTLSDGGEFPHPARSWETRVQWGSDPGIPFSATFPDPDGRMPSGRSTTVALSRTWKDVVLVPREAIQSTENLPFVLVVDANHVVRRRKVETIDRQGDEIVVKQGLKAGDRVAVDRFEAIHEGDTVEDRVQLSIEEEFHRFGKP